MTAYDPKALQDLLARVEAATGADRLLDVAVARATGLLTCWQSKHGYFNFEFGDKKESTFEFYSSDRTDDGWPLSEDPLLDISYRLDIPEYTAGIDASLALVERVLGKHWLYLIKSGVEKCCVLWMVETDYDDHGAPTGWHADSVPLAILAALLKALIANAPQA